MLDITKGVYRKYFLIGGLYFTVGLNDIICVLILPLYFLEQGIHPELITLVIGITIIPMVIKFVWGGISDYFIRFGRKPFIIFGGLIDVFSLIVLAFINPNIFLLPFAIFLFVSWCGIGFLSASLDALAISISVEGERGKINGAKGAGMNIGLVIGALLLPFVVQNFDYSMLFLIVGFLLLPIILFPLIIKEVKIVEKQQKVRVLLIQEFKKRTTLLMAIFAVFVTMSSGVILLITPIWMNMGLNLDITQVGFITMLFTIAMVFGSLIGGVVADRFDRKDSLYILIFVSILFSILLIFTDTWLNFAIVYSIIGFLQGCYFTSFSAMFMDVTNPRIGATQFSIFNGLANLGFMSTSIISGFLYVTLGISLLFLCSACVFVPSLVLLYFIKLEKKNSGK